MLHLVTVGVHGRPVPLPRRRRVRCEWHCRLRRFASAFDVGLGKEREGCGLDLLRSPWVVCGASLLEDRIAICHLKAVSVPTIHSQPRGHISRIGHTLLIMRPTCALFAGGHGCLQPEGCY